MPTHFPAGPWMRSIFFFENVERQWSWEVWWHVTGAIPGMFNIETAASGLDASLNPLIVSCMHPSSAYLGLNLYVNNSVYTVDGRVFGETTGTGSGDPLPTEDAVVVTINSGVGTRKGVGRIFFSGLDDSMTENSRLNSTGLTNFTALASAMMATVDIGGAVVSLAVWSRSLGTINPAIFAQPADVLGHQSKRRPRR